MSKKTADSGPKFRVSVHAKPGALLVGGVNTYRGTPQPSFAEALNLLRAYIDGQEDKIESARIYPVEL